MLARNNRIRGDHGICRVKDGVYLRGGGGGGVGGGGGGGGG
jgi:hypothetical protein